MYKDSIANDYLMVMTTLKENINSDSVKISDILHKNDSLANVIISQDKEIKSLETELENEKTFVETWMGRWANRWCLYEKKKNSFNSYFFFLEFDSFFSSFFFYI